MLWSNMVEPPTTPPRPLVVIHPDDILLLYKQFPELNDQQIADMCYAYAPAASKGAIETMKCPRCNHYIAVCKCPRLKLQPSETAVKKPETIFRNTPKGR